MARNPHDPAADPPRLSVVSDDGTVSPAPVDGMLKPPTIEGDPVASAEWDRQVAAGGAKPQEAGLLAAYCSTLSRVERLRAELLKLDDLFVTNVETGAVKTHPVVGSLNGAERLLAMHAARLGLTPVDRSRVKNGRAEYKNRKADRYLK